MIAKAFKIFGVNILVFLVLLLLFEATLQVIALIHPSYDVLFLQPDKVLGWKQVPNHHWTSTGHKWYASDFSVNVETNALGFRDIAREFPKPRRVKRVALLGDSFIEAVQVPLEKTAGQLLNQSLDSASAQDSKHPWHWEVLNFGISNFGVGQYLLTWEQYVRDYEPDYTAIFVAKFHMQRTVSKYEYGAFSASKKTGLWVRPTFRVENDELIREPAKDFDEFIKVQENLMKTEFAGQRSRRKRTLITVQYAREFKDRLTRLVRRFDQSPKQISSQSIGDSDAEANLLTVNLKIIEELGSRVTSKRGRLVILDASRYFGDDEAVSSALKELCVKNRLGYIPLYDDLMKANMDGISTRWAGDSHFNEAGNQVLANALFVWITQHSKADE